MTRREQVQAVLDRVDADLHRLRGVRSGVRVVDDPGHGPQLHGDGDAQADLSLDGPALDVEVARAAQDSLVEQVWTAGPLCRAHDRALRPALHEGRLVWRCVGGHVLADVGGLRPAESTW